MPTEFAKYYVLDENNNAVPSDSFEWGDQFEHMGNKRIVGSNEINNHIVSTVWLGLNHRWNIHEGPPLLFETMVFDDSDNPYEYQERYSTWKEAEEGHQKAIQWVKDRFKEEEKN